MHEADKKVEVLKLLEDNARYSVDEIADITGLSREDVEKIISECENEKSILKYKTIIDWEKLGEEFVVALIDVRVNLTREKNYDDIARRIAKFPEVHAVRLVSGEYDFQIVVKGKSLKDVSFFVSEKVSTLPEVRDTNTHFVLKSYKEEGVLLFSDEEDRRLAIVP
ncbi:transcriptional regulator, AsnC family [Archaeoglobus sulfaticallidus PM70-1]|uniref:Transcriptional regulator, AsnC family n=1 Tax=Archaeoglobus sulfaticallidus PM70-1 TaxID=387631 RepID=N0BFP1_9EURY|nr:Lrp/AsnC family transcriptional regulator [Archaeoglobus sulfaticallidus]AGK61848.1 transcriptional regulator, AsnC family [Archaeoglobus sulfaticallidus PM70-1]